MSFTVGVIVLMFSLFLNVKQHSTFHSVFRTVQRGQLEFSLCGITK